MLKFEYVGGPLDGVRPGDGHPFMAQDGGTYAATGGVVRSGNGEPRVAIRWTPTPGGARNAPECREACSRGCPAYGATA